MSKKYNSLDKNVKDWIDENEQHLQESYSEYVSEMRDSIEHKSYMINNDNCFYEWCEEQFESISQGD